MTEDLARFVFNNGIYAQKLGERYFEVQAAIDKADSLSDVLRSLGGVGSIIYNYEKEKLYGLWVTV
jgi:hypothetical protein